VPAGSGAFFGALVSFCRVVLSCRRGVCVPFGAASVGWRAFGAPPVVVLLRSFLSLLLVVVVCAPPLAVLRWVVSPLGPLPAVGFSFFFVPFCSSLCFFFCIFVVGVGGFFWAVSFSFLLCPSFLLVSVFSPSPLRSSAALPAPLAWCVLPASRCLPLVLPAGSLSPSWVRSVRAAVGLRWCPRPCSAVLLVLLRGGVPPLVAVPAARLLGGVGGVSVVWGGRGSRSFRLLGASAPLVAAAWVRFFRACGFRGAFSVGSGASCLFWFGSAAW